MKTLALVIVLLMVPFTNLNTVLYLVFFPWRSTLAGRAVMMTVASLTLLVDGAVFYKFVPASPGKQIVTVVIYALILAGMVRMTYALVTLLWTRREPRP